MKILQLSCHFLPNVGGVETHLDDLTKVLAKENELFVLTYRPLTTKTNWSIWEINNNIRILRIPWFPGLFYKLVNNPILEFLYLFPGIFGVIPFVLLLNRPRVIHAHGLVAGFVGAFWGKLFGIRTVISLHSIYHFPAVGLYSQFVKFIFRSADCLLTLSKQSAIELQELGISKDKIKVFTYWVDLKKFKVKNPKPKIKSKLRWEGFNVLYVGRLIAEKGIEVLLKSAKTWDKNINLKIVGTGPLEENIKSQISRIKNIELIGKVDNNKLTYYYTEADILIVPSIHEEGFGRVILESLACGTPVIGSNRGAISEAMDNSVGKLIDITPENISRTILYFYENGDKLKNISKNARKFAEERYSEKNVEKIISCYTK